MTLLEQVQQAKTPRAAIMLLAQAIDELLAQPDEWDEWAELEKESAPAEPTASNSIQVKQGDGQAEVVLPTPSVEKQLKRATFADQQIKLGEYAKNANEWPDEPEGGLESWTDVYSIAGPYWLYTVDREFVMSLNRTARTAMIEDIEEDDPETARIVARDILKYSGEDTAINI